MTANIQRIIIVSSLFANSSRKILNPLKEKYIRGEERLNSFFFSNRLPVFHVHWSLLFCYRPIKKIELIHYPRGHFLATTPLTRSRNGLWARDCRLSLSIPLELSLFAAKAMFWFCVNQSDYGKSYTQFWLWPELLVERVQSQKK